MATSWRITEQTPVRNLGRMDYERCGALHNEIMERSWVGAGHSLESMDRTTYWDRWHNDSSWTPEHLHPSVLEFLKIAIAGTTSESFFWTVGGIYGPKVMLETNNNMYSDDEHRYITIYATNMICGVSHKAGIVLDQRGFNAVFQPSIWDMEKVMFGQVWQPLEVILDNYLEMIDQGKVVAFPRNGRPSPEEGQPQREGSPPWVMEPFTEIDLQQTILQWERLVEAIESRMPTGTLSPDNTIGYGCFDPSSDDDFDMFPKHGFARRLLSAARRPRFQFIAPGLWCIGADTQTQPFSNLRPNRYGDGRMRPVLLARGEQNAVEGDGLIFKTAFETTAEAIPSGMYLTEYNPDRPNPWEVRQSHKFSHQWTNQAPRVEPFRGVVIRREHRYTCR